MTKYKHFKPPEIHIGAHETHRDRALAKAEEYEALLAKAKNDGARKRIVEWMERSLEIASYYDDCIRSGK